MKNEEKEYREMKRLALNELNFSDAIKSQPQIIRRSLIAALIRFFATWILCGMLYFIINGFTGQDKRKEQYLDEVLEEFFEFLKDKKVKTIPERR